MHLVLSDAERATVLAAIETFKRNNPIDSFRMERLAESVNGNQFDRFVVQQLHGVLMTSGNPSAIDIDLAKIRPAMEIK